MTNSVETVMNVLPSTELKARKIYAASIGASVLFIFIQSFTAGEFLTSGLSTGVVDAWTTVHGFVAYPIMVFSLTATIVAVRSFGWVRGLAVASGTLFVSSVLQWLLGHAITNLGWDWVTPFHIVLAFVVYGLAIWLSVKSVALRKLAAS